MRGIRVQPKLAAPPASRPGQASPQPPPTRSLGFSQQSARLRNGRPHGVGLARGEGRQPVGCEVAQHRVHGDVEPPGRLLAHRPPARVLGHPCLRLTLHLLDEGHARLVIHVLVVGGGVGGRESESDAN